MRMLPLNLGVLLLCSLPALARDPKPLNLSLVPQEGAAPEKFVPPEWTIDVSAKGDLDGNGSEDVVLQLVEAGPKQDAEGFISYARALLVLLSEDGKWRRAAASTKVLGCSDCTIPPPGEGGRMLKVDKGVIVLEQLFDGPDGVVMRFGYDPKDKRFVLTEAESFMPVPSQAGDTEQRVTTSPLKGQKVTRKVRYLSPTKTKVLSTKKEKAPVRRLYLEDVTHDMEF